MQIAFLWNDQDQAVQQLSKLIKEKVINQASQTLRNTQPACKVGNRIIKMCTIKVVCRQHWTMPKPIEASATQQGSDTMKPRQQGRIMYVPTEPDVGSRFCC
jgi:hypothetical protein